MSTAGSCLENLFFNPGGFDAGFYNDGSKMGSLARLGFE